VKGARVLLSTKTANRIIADVYAVSATICRAIALTWRTSCAVCCRERKRCAARPNQSGAARRSTTGPMSSAAQALLDSPQAVTTPRDVTTTRILPG